MSNPNMNNANMGNPFEHPHIPEDKAEREFHRIKRRTRMLITFFCAILALFTAVLYQTQIVHGGDYLVITNTHVTRTQQVNSVRGEILDTYGRVLVTNELRYNVELNWDDMGNDRNAIVERLLTICREEGVAWSDALPVSGTAPWTYTTDAPFSVEEENDEGETETFYTQLGRLARLEQYEWLDPNGKQPEPSAAQLLTAMCVSFGLVEEGEAPSREDRELAGVLYELCLRQNEVNYNSYVFARGVDIAFITKVKEHSLNGVAIVTATARKYETHYAAHVLGYTGFITPETWAWYKERGYPMNATVGQDGVELAFEERLHGVSGERLMELDGDGNIISQQWQAEPEPGENVVLTLDIALQSAVEDILAQYIARQEEEHPMAAAVVDMTGGVLALASYPGYDMTTFWDDYADLAADAERSPLVNRAVTGLYAPGSTFKPLAAVAALDTGSVTTTERMVCTGTYMYYAPSYTPHCWVYPWSHGSISISTAITESCNAYFFEAGRRTTIDTLNRYAQRFGLGEYTGIELAEEKGYRAGPETSAILGLEWYEGNTLSAAIGQENNRFTPLQLANYIATLVNGGKHYRCHLLKEFKSSDYSSVTEVYEPVLLDSIDIQPEHLAAIKQGMYDLAHYDDMIQFFAPLPVEVGGKTGTAETADHAATTNAIFVCFAPYDDPQVALCIVWEGGSSARPLAEPAAAILAQYFSTDSSLNTVTGENTLLR